MQSITKGLDVSKDKIAVAIAEAGREEPRWYGTIPHTAEALRKLIKQLGIGKPLLFVTKPDPRVMKPTDGFHSWEPNAVSLHPHSFRGVQETVSKRIAVMPFNWRGYFELAN